MLQHMRYPTICMEEDITLARKNAVEMARYWASDRCWASVRTRIIDSGGGVPLGSGGSLEMYSVVVTGMSCFYLGVIA